MDLFISALYRLRTKKREREEKKEDVYRIRNNNNEFFQPFLIFRFLSIFFDFLKLLFISSVKI